MPIDKEEVDPLDDKDLIPVNSFSDSNIDLDTEAAILRLARRISNASSLKSVPSSLQPKDPNTNPFTDSSDPLLDPFSDSFSSRAWSKHLLSIKSRDPDKFPGRNLGVSFQDLGAYGYGTGFDYQKTVGNSLFEITYYLKLLLRIKDTRNKKIQILQGFDGIVEHGEMCVVLGRPGRYVKKKIKKTI